MSKVLIVPCYKDFYKLDWVKEFNKRTNYTFKIIIYEKRDKIKKEIKLNEQHYLLPAYGEGTFQLFYHIIKNYNNHVFQVLNYS
jgi:spermidine/putrescine-binding protein